MYLDKRERNAQKVKNANGCFDAGSVEGFTAGCCDVCGRWDSELRKVHDTHLCRHQDCSTIVTNVAQSMDTSDPKMWELAVGLSKTIIAEVTG